jgi:hypothetical protein
MESTDKFEFPAKVKQSDALSSCLSPHKPFSFAVPLVPCVFAYFLFLWVILLFKMALSVELKCQLLFTSARRLMCLMEKIQMLEGLRLDKSHGAYSHEFNGNIPVMCVK